MPTPRSPSSSPDPLAMADPVHRRPQASSARPSTFSSATVPMSIASPSPRKMTATSHIDTMSPWRIKVVVEAERDSDEEDGGVGPANEDTPLRGRGAARGKRRGGAGNGGISRGRTVTTKVPVKGLESSPGEETEGEKDATKLRRKATPKRKASGSRNRKKKDVAQGGGGMVDTITVAQLVEDEDDDIVQEPPAKPKPRKKSVTRKPRTKAAEKSIVEGDTFDTPKPRKRAPAKRNTRKPTDKADAPTATPTTRTRKRRSVASAVESEPEEPDFLPPTLRARTPSISSSPPRAVISYPSLTAAGTSQQSYAKTPNPLYPDTSVIRSPSLHEGDTYTLPSFSSTHRGPRNAGAPEDDDNEDDPWYNAERPREAEAHDFDDTYLSNGISYTPRTVENHGRGPKTPRAVPTPKVVGVESFYGDDMDYEEEFDANDARQESILPDDLTEPAEADFTHVSHGTSYTSRVRKAGTLEPPTSSGTGRKGANDVTAETFYGADVDFDDMEDDNDDGHGPAEADIDSGPSYTPRHRMKGALDPMTSIRKPRVPDVSATSLYSNQSMASNTIKGKAAETSTQAATPEVTPELSSPHRPEDANPTRLTAENLNSRLCTSTRYITPETRSKSSSSMPPKLAAPSRRSENETPDLGRIVEATDNLSRTIDDLETKAQVQQSIVDGVLQQRSASRGSRMPTPPESVDDDEACTTVDEQDITHEQSMMSPTPGSVDRTALLEAQWAKERREVRRKAEEVGAITIDDDVDDDFDDDDGTHTPTEEEEDEDDSQNMPGHRTQLLEQQWAAERAAVAATAFEVGAITIHSDDSSVRITTPGSRTPASSFANSNRGEDTIDFETSLTQHLANQSGVVCSPGVTRHGDMQPEHVLWKPAQYAHLLSVLNSRSTPDTCPTKYEVLIFMRHPALKGWTGRIGVDKEGWMELTGKEAATVERFVRREKVMGREWSRQEVVRRVAGIRIARIMGVDGV